VCVLIQEAELEFFVGCGLGYKNVEYFIFKISANKLSNVDKFITLEANF
jgi:hypothetical protein